MRRLALFLIAAAACPDPYRLDERTFPCRVPEDCVGGFFCHPARFVCVRVGTATASDAGRMDARLQDALTLDALVFEDAKPFSEDAETSTITDAGPPPDSGPGGIGADCSAAMRCVQGTCVDGVCCKDTCAGSCMRCDLVRGDCVPVPDGQDPDRECAGERFDCATLTFGLEMATCLACPEGPAPGATCDGAGRCRASGCVCERGGERLSNCLSGPCLREDACPRFARAEDWDQRAELCAIGRSCGGLFAGCCGPRGLCCPAPDCSEDSDQCR